MKKTILWVISLALCISCQAWQPGVPVQTLSATPSVTAMPLFTASPSSTPVATSTQTPSPTPILEPTFTPLPTLSPDETIRLIRQLVQDNGGCRLPCVWGLTPGKTKPAVLYQFMDQFTNYDIKGKIYVDVRSWLTKGAGGLSFDYQEQNIILGVNLSYYLDKSRTKIYLLEIDAGALYDYGLTPEGFRDIRPIDGNDERFRRLMAYYLLPQILTRYGVPEEVWVAAFPDIVDRPDIKGHPFSVLLFYRSQGFLVEYVSLRKTIGDKYAFCPKMARLSVATWSPEDSPSLEYIAKMAGDELNELNISYFKPLAVATGMDEQQFYETFRRTSSGDCLLTPKSLWPPVP